MKKKVIHRGSHGKWVFRNVLSTFREVNNFLFFLFFSSLWKVEMEATWLLTSSLRRLLSRWREEGFLLSSRTRSEHSQVKVDRIFPGGGIFWSSSDGKRGTSYQQVVNLSPANPVSWPINYTIRVSDHAYTRCWRNCQLSITHGLPGCLSLSPSRKTPAERLPTTKNLCCLSTVDMVDGCVIARFFALSDFFLWAF